MAIDIVSNLEPRPRKTIVPGDVTLMQTMISDQQVEQVMCEFRLANGHDVWFELPSGTRSKTIPFTHEVGPENTEVQFNISLVRDAGTAIDGSIGIDETLTDAGGIAIHDRCTIVIL